MINGDISGINIIFDIKKNIERKKRDSINIFGFKFVNNNKNNCKLIIDDKEYKLIEKYNIKQYKKNILNIKLEGINNINDMSYMFEGCSSLLSLPDISKWNTKKVTDMNTMFSGCSSLFDLPDISKWNIRGISSMLSGCLNVINKNNNNKI